MVAIAFSGAVISAGAVDCWGVIAVTGAVTDWKIYLTKAAGGECPATTNHLTSQAHYSKHLFLFFSSCILVLLVPIQMP